MDVNIENKEWETMSREEKNHLLFLKQKETLALFLERGAISKVQYDKSLRDLKMNMGEEDT